MSKKTNLRAPLPHLNVRRTLKRKKDWLKKQRPKCQKKKKEKLNLRGGKLPLGIIVRKRRLLTQVEKILELLLHPYTGAS